MALRMSRTKLGIVVAATGVAIACIWWAVGSSSEESSRPSRTQEGSTATSVDRRAKGRARQAPFRNMARLEQRRQFLIMRSPPERMPARSGNHIEATIGAPRGSLDLRGAQRASSTRGKLWIVNGTLRGAEITCLLQGKRGYVACTRTARFGIQGIMIGITSKPKHKGELPRRFYVLGVAPDWVGSVSVRSGDYGTRKIPVHGNSYVSPVADAPVFVERFCSHSGRVCRRP